MGRPRRADVGGLIYHALNRANARATLFDDDGDYDAFVRVLAQAVAGQAMRLLAYCVMPNHFHLVVRTRADGDLARFLRWLTLTHTQRWHAHHGTAGTGHLYQGRYKSFPVQDDAHLLTVCRYVERNALRAGLVARAEDWRWGSLGRASLDGDDGPTLSPWPIARPANWVKRVNAALSPAEEEAMARSIRRGQPFGGPIWRERTSRQLGLESAFRPRGRPRKPADP